MGKKANEKRRALFENLDRQGKLPNPVSKERKVCRTCRKKPDATGFVDGQCRRCRTPSECFCLDRYGGSLPSVFKRCRDCPA